MIPKMQSIKSRFAQLRRDYPNNKKLRIDAMLYNQWCNKHCNWYDTTLNPRLATTLDEWDALCRSYEVNGPTDFGLLNRDDLDAMNNRVQIVFSELKSGKYPKQSDKLGNAIKAFQAHYRKTVNSLYVSDEDLATAAKLRNQIEDLISPIAVDPTTGKKAKASQIARKLSSSDTNVQAAIQSTEQNSKLTWVALGLAGVGLLGGGVALYLAKPVLGAKLAASGLLLGGATYGASKLSTPSILSLPKST